MRLSGKLTGVFVVLLLTFTVGAFSPGHADPPTDPPAHAGSDGYYQPYSNDFTGMEGAWTAEKDGPQDHDQVHIDWDVPITMSDGKVLKANVYRPMDGNVVVTDRLPTILNLTPYTKWAMAILSKLVNAPGIQDGILRFIGSLQSSDPGLKNFMLMLQTLDGGIFQTISADKQLIRSGYVWIDVDVRGTGFSEGKWDVFGPREQQDTPEIIDWISKQDFSDGKVGMTGYSADAISAVQAATHRPPALKAIFAGSPGIDLIEDVAARGAGLNAGFLPFWLWLVNFLKKVPDLQSMALGTYNDEYAQWRQDRAEDRDTLSDLMATALSATTVDDVKNDPEALRFLDSKSDWRKAVRADLSKINIPTMITGMWGDLFRNGEYRSFAQLTGLGPDKKKLIMSDGYHLFGGAGYGKRDAPPRMDVLQKAWFDHWIKGIDNGVEKFGPVIEQMQGTLGWQQISQLPRPGMVNKRMYLNGQESGTTNMTLHDGSLTPDVPANPDEFTVKVGLTSLCSDITADTYMGLTGWLMACAQDERFHEQGGLTFTSSEVQVPTVISGPIAVHLNTKLEGTDGFWMASVTDVDDLGQSTLLGAGWVTTSVRAVDEKRSKRGPNGDYIDPIQVLSINDYQPVKPGENTIIDFGTHPVDAVLQPGHRLRVSVFASNYPTALPPMPMLVGAGFKPPPFIIADLVLWMRPENFYPEHLVLDPKAPSWISIPSSDPIQ